MLFILLLLSSVGYVSYFTLEHKLKFSSAQFVYIMCITLILYFCAIGGFLQVGVALSLGGGIALLLVVLFRHFEKIKSLNKRPSGEVVCSGFYFIPVLIFYASISSKFLFTGWDEFSFWASSIKVIYQTNALYVEGSPVAFKYYPPGQQLFQYYFTYLTAWSEKNVLLAQIIFMLSCLICVTGSLHKKITPLSIVTYFASCALIYYFGLDFAHIFIDGILGLMFAAAISLALTNRGIKGTLIVSASVALLVIAKQIGLILSLVVIAVYFLASVFRERAESDDLKFHFSSLLKQSISALVCLAAIYFTFKTWGWYVKSINAYTSFLLPDFTTVLQTPMLERLGTTSIEFIRRLHTDAYTSYTPDFIRAVLAKIDVFPNASYLIIKNLPEAIALSVAGLLGSLLVCSTVCVLLSKKAERLKNLSVFGCLAVGAVGYLAFLLICYLVFFSEYEGVRLASFERYVSSYFLAWTLIVLACYSASVDNIKSRCLKIIGAVPIMCIILFSPLKFYSDMILIDSPPEPLNVRLKVESLSSAVKNRIKPGEKAYFISQNSIGFEKYAFNYEMIPNNSVWWCWSVGDLYFPTDVWTCKKSLPGLLSGYKYLVIYHADEQFWRDNSQYFAADSQGKESGAYEINEKNGVIEIQEIK
ncbi:hypothetical protein [Pseudomonas sp. PD9R]|uniref:hypothetical protein n=1 Tax=Pseudomonas sp. PD9R TaxID=2853534 RepID=UPI001C476EBF|nr:hypothetical protein [Pseudomonas sp. PD9R]MBV6826567.1 hypothetical protein [Pseudomonas sp. PD9R]